MHRWVLHHRSEYFRAYFATLQPLVEAKVEEKGAGMAKRRRVTAVISSDCESAVEGGGDRCNGHSPLTHCIDLPDQCGIAESNECDVLLFLQHLYFSSTLCLPPFEPLAELVASALTGSPSLAFPSDVALCRPRLRHHAVPELDGFHISEPLLSLFHYLDCRQALQRCEEVVLSDFSLYSPLTCRHLLPCCSVCGLKTAEARCIYAVAKDGAVRLDDAQYAERLQRVLRMAPQVLPRLVAAMSSHLDPSYPYTRPS